MYRRIAETEAKKGGIEGKKTIIQGDIKKRINKERRKIG
jgi:hypothetical protein